MCNEALGFSMWLDFIERRFMASDFQKMVERGVVNGATSNPSIFSQAIRNSSAYMDQLGRLRNLSPKARYEALAKEDIARAAEVLMPLYEAQNDGLVSLEVDPFLCDDTQATIEEGRRLHREIGLPNVMIKIPATDAGYEAMRTLMSEGIHVNATLIFSPKQAMEALRALQEGLVIHQTKGDGSVLGVLSIFVSRFDRMLDQTLIEKGIAPGRVGIMNAAAIYNRIEAVGQKALRALFASTGVKSQAYQPDYYIKALMAPHSINTAPLETIEAFLKAPDHKPALPIDDEAIGYFFQEIEEAGIAMEDIYRRLIDQGLQAFQEAFAKLLADLES